MEGTIIRPADMESSTLSPNRAGLSSFEGMARTQELKENIIDFCGPQVDPTLYTRECEGTRFRSEVYSEQIPSIFNCYTKVSLLTFLNNHPLELLR